MKTWARVMFPALFVLSLAYLTRVTVVAAGGGGDKKTTSSRDDHHDDHHDDHNDDHHDDCGHHCPAGTTCHDDHCVSICGPGTTFCGATGCANLNSDNQNCGACGSVCTAPNSCVGGHCVNVCSGVCAPGTTFCGTRCEATQTDPNNCGACGHVCVAPDTACVAGVCRPPCAPGQILCGSTCVDPDSDPDNCGACGTVCDPTDTCVAGTCTPREVADSCLPASSLSVLIQGSNVTAYVPQGSWSFGVNNVKVVPVEPAGVPVTVVTAGRVNSCSSNNVTATTVCTGNSNDIYVINGTALSATPTANATASQGFSGGSCQTCGVAFDAGTGLAWIAEGKSAGVGQLEPLNPPSAFGAPIGLFTQQTSENIQIDPVRKLILSANENNNWQIIKSDTRVVYNSTATFPLPRDGEMDSTAEDCSTGVALAPLEFTTRVAFANLKGITYPTAGVAGVSAGTWAAPTFIQDFAPDFNGLAAGNSGSAVAPGSSHLAIIAGEFAGSSKFGVLQLPASIGAGDTPMATDWVAADVPNLPSGAPWIMGFDPHTVTAYKSPTGTAYALMSNSTNSHLVKVDMALLLGAPRLAGTHTADPLTIPAGTFTFIAQ
jgi:hypothetical protein